LRTTDRIYEIIAASIEPVTLAEIQKNLDVSAGIVSGSLASLCRSKRLQREKREITNGNGPKLRWVYFLKKD
jgi:DNA-binding transcriptional regulator GbsR (MarR family)